MNNNKFIISKKTVERMIAEETLKVLNEVEGAPFINSFDKQKAIAAYEEYLKAKKFTQGQEGVEADRVINAAVQQGLSAEQAGGVSGYEDFARRFLPDALKPRFKEFVKTPTAAEPAAQAASADALTARVSRDAPSILAKQPVAQDSAGSKPSTDADIDDEFLTQAIQEELISVGGKRYQDILMYLYSNENYDTPQDGVDNKYGWRTRCAVTQFYKDVGGGTPNHQDKRGILQFIKANKSKVTNTSLLSNAEKNKCRPATDKKVDGTDAVEKGESPEAKKEPNKAADSGKSNIKFDDRRLAELEAYKAKGNFTNEDIYFLLTSEEKPIGSVSIEQLNDWKKIKGKPIYYILEKNPSSIRAFENNYTRYNSRQAVLSAIATIRATGNFTGTRGTKTQVSVKDYSTLFVSERSPDGVTTKTVQASNFLGKDEASNNVLASRIDEYEKWKEETGLKYDAKVYRLLNPKVDNVGTTKSYTFDEVKDYGKIDPNDIYTFYATDPTKITSAPKLQDYFRGGTVFNKNNVWNIIKKLIESGTERRQLLENVKLTIGFPKSPINTYEKLQDWSEFAKIVNELYMEDAKSKAEALKRSSGTLQGDAQQQLRIVQNNVDAIREFYNLGYAGGTATDKGNPVSADTARIKAAEEFFKLGDDLDEATIISVAKKHGLLDASDGLTLIQMTEKGKPIGDMISLYSVLSYKNKDGEELGEEHENLKTSIKKIIDDKLTDKKYRNILTNEYSLTERNIDRLIKDQISRLTREGELGTFDQVIEYAKGVGGDLLSMARQTLDTIAGLPTWSKTMLLSVLALKKFLPGTPLEESKINNKILISKKTLEKIILEETINVLTEQPLNPTAPADLPDPNLINPPDVSPTPVLTNAAARIANAKQFAGQEFKSGLKMGALMAIFQGIQTIYSNKISTYKQLVDQMPEGDKNKLYAALKKLKENQKREIEYFSYMKKQDISEEEIKEIMEKFSKKIDELYEIYFKQHSIQLYGPQGGEIAGSLVGGAAGGALGGLIVGAFLASNPAGWAALAIIGLSSAGLALYGAIEGKEAGASFASAVDQQEFNIISDEAIYNAIDEKLKDITDKVFQTYGDRVVARQWAIVKERVRRNIIERYEYLSSEGEKNKKQFPNQQFSNNRLLWSNDKNFYLLQALKDISEMQVEKLISIQGSVNNDKQLNGLNALTNNLQTTNKKLEQTQQKIVNNEKRRYRPKRPQPPAPQQDRYADREEWESYTNDMLASSDKPRPRPRRMQGLQERFYITKNKLEAIILEETKKVIKT